jgi:DNA-binding NtrC family response regulator
VSAARILLVDDDQQLLHLLEKYLKRLDYEVDAYSRSTEALRVFETSGDRFDVVIADLGMPEISGDTLLTKMLELNPNLSMLICSGSPFSVASLPPSMHSQIAFLQKPFTPHMLSDSIRQLLSRPKPA